MCISFKYRREWAGVGCIIVVETVLGQKKTVFIFIAGTDYTELAHRTS